MVGDHSSTTPQEEEEEEEVKIVDFHLHTYIDIDMNVQACVCACICNVYVPHCAQHDESCNDDHGNYCEHFHVQARVCHILQVQTFLS